MSASMSDDLSSRLVTAFFSFSRSPWHNVPAQGLSRAETAVLESIKRADRRGTELRVPELSAILRVSPSTVTQHLNHLERKDLVERRQADEDKRAVHLSLTEKGYSALESHRNALMENFNEFIELIGSDKAETFTELLTRANDYFVQKAKAYENDYLIDGR